MLLKSTKASFGVVVMLVVILFVGFSDLGLAQINPDGINLDDWEAPRELRKAFPYYISGLDHEGQPVFVLEYGKWNVRQYFEDGGDAKELDTYADQTVYRWSKAEKNLNITEGSGFFGLIVDFEGFDARHLAHRKAVAFSLRMTRKGIAVAAPKFDYGIFINMNYVADIFFTNLVAPIIVNFFSKVETSGTNKAKWLPLLFKKIPKESLPPWYGGSEKFSPLAVYG